MDKHLIHYKGIKVHLLILVIMTIIQGVLLIYQAVFLAKAIANMFNGAAIAAVLPYFFGFAVMYTLRNIILWLKDRISYLFADKTSTYYHNRLVQELFELGPRVIGKKGSGNIITLLIEGVPKFRTYLELFIPKAVSMLCIPLLVLIYVFNADTLSGIILFLTMPIMLAFLILLGLVSQKHTNAQWGTYQLLSRHFVDSLRGLVTLKFLGKSKSHQSAIEKVSNQYRIATNRTLRLAFLSTFSLEFFTSLSVAVVAVELGLRLIEGVMGLELALIVLILAPEYFQPVRDIGNDYHATMDGKDAGKQIHGLLEKSSSEYKAESILLPKWTGKSYLTVKKLSKQTDEGKTILKDIDFHIEGFQKVGIVGASGSGKSTLIDILSGFSLPTDGNISVNGTELKNFSLSSWQGQAGYIPQHPYIFSGSVAENISFYAPNVTREEMIKAIKVTGLEKLVQSLPEGLDEMIGNGGRSLSGGEEQRIALTRSFLQRHPIMLFDEPTAHLDIETEHEMKKLMLPLMKDKLIFFATHRLHWMREMDVIYLLDNGQIIETGSYEELMNRRGAFYQLVQAQLGGTGS